MNAITQDPSPSGAQLELRAGDRRAVITEVGATLRLLQVGGVDLLDGFAADAMASGGRGQVLCPWPNRIDGGRYTFAGQAHQLPLTEIDRRNANHGLVRWLPFRIVEHQPSAVTLALRLYPQPGYPFLLDLQIEYALRAGALSVTLTAHNPGAGPLPFGAGMHPYFRTLAERIDEARLLLPAATRLLTNERAIPVGREVVAGTPFDFRAARAIGDLVLDTGYTDLQRDAEGWARVVLTPAGAGPQITLALDERYGYLQIYSGDNLPRAEQRRRGLAIEPMTCAPNAFCSGEGLRTLAPGERLRCVFSITGE